MSKSNSTRRPAPTVTSRQKPAKSMSSDDCGELIGRMDEALAIILLVKEAVLSEAGTNRYLSASFSALDTVWDILDLTRDDLDACKVRTAQEIADEEASLAAINGAS